MLLMIEGKFLNVLKHIGGVIGSVFTLIVVDRGFELPTGSSQRLQNKR